MSDIITNEDYMREVYCHLNMLASEDSELIEKLHDDTLMGTLFIAALDKMIEETVAGEALILVHAMNTAGITIEQAAKALYIANIGMDRYKKG